MCFICWCGMTILTCGIRSWVADHSQRKRDDRCMVFLVTSVKWSLSLSEDSTDELECCVVSSSSIFALNAVKISSGFVEDNLLVMVKSEGGISTTGLVVNFTWPVRGRAKRTSSVDESFKMSSLLGVRRLSSPVMDCMSRMTGWALLSNPCRAT